MEILRLSVELDGKTIISNKLTTGIFRKAKAVWVCEETATEEVGDLLVYELFDGTEITHEVIENLEVFEMEYLSEEAFEIFFDEMARISELKNRKRPLMITTKAMGKN